MKNCPLAIKILSKYTENLVENPLKCKIKQFVRKTPNIESIDSVLQAIEAFVSDDNSSKNWKVRKSNVLRTKEAEHWDKQGRQCFLCHKIHKFRLTESTYTCS